eukprot:jgi/Botrbrau1/20602/Bobra.113_1s0028.1
MSQARPIFPHLSSQDQTLRTDQLHRYIYSQKGSEPLKPFWAKIGNMYRFAPDPQR